MNRITRMLAAGAASAIVGVAIVTGVGAAGAGHTPVTLCHFVPAHGGSYIIITVDDDGSSGNKNGQGHMGHGDDIIPANPDGTCGSVPD